MARYLRREPIQIIHAFYSLDLNNLEKNFLDGIKYIGRNDVYRLLISESKNIAKHSHSNISEPYPGMRSFNERESEIFYGREEETQEIEGILNKNGSVFVVGNSGAGKSSVLHAGIIPRFKLENYRICVSTPGRGESPILSLVRSLLEHLERVNIEKISDKLYETADINLLLDASIHGEWIICIDQLEEIFSPVFSNEMVYRYLHIISKICQNKSYKFIATIRTDFLNKILSYEVIGFLIQKYTFLLGPISDTSLCRAITNPADMMGINIEPELLERIINDRDKENNGLPLIACALRKLYKTLESNKLMSMKMYESIGGLRGIVANLADSALKKCGEIRPEVIDRVFGALVHMNESTMAPVRRRALISVFSDESSKKMIEEFVNERLFVTGKSLENEPMVEVAHEAIYVEWEHYSKWIKEKGEQLHLIRRMQLNALDWERQGNKPEQLLPNEMLLPIYNAIDTLEYKPSKLEKNYLESEEKRIWKRLRSPNTDHQTRALLGVRLNEIGDNRVGIGIDKNETPVFEWIDCSKYFESGKYGRIYVSKYLVTNCQFLPYINMKYNKGMGIGKEDESINLYGNHPTGNISWVDACEFCLWIKKICNINVRLPTVDEWQNLAKKAELNLKFPWGNKFENNLANTYKSGLNRSTAVGVYDNEKNNEQISDLIGNLWEWCSDMLNDNTRLLCGFSFKPRKGGIKITETLKLEKNYKDADLGMRLWRFEEE